MANPPTPAEIFQKDGYLVLKGFLENPLLHVAHRYSLMKVQTTDTFYNDDLVAETPSLYADTLMETLLEVATPQIEQMVGLSLFPTYSYFRVYKNGDELPAHIDRPSCEISMTMCLGFDISNLNDPNYRWPIHIDNSRNYSDNRDIAFKPGKETEGQAIPLSPGECMLYRGCEVRHWRHAFQGQYQSQVFMHYVDQNGPYAKYRFDTRPSLGMAADTMKIPKPHSA